MVATLCLCLLAAAPLTANSHSQSKAAICLSNLRQLASAWQLYASEHNDRFVENYGGGDALGGAAGLHPAKAPWALGWLDWTTRRDNTNLLFIRHQRYARLTPYINAERNIHKCPADMALHPSQRAAGWTARVRSVSLNAPIGAGNAIMGPFEPYFKQVIGFSDLNNVRQRPAELITFLDEHADSINDPMYYPTSGTRWIDVPASSHHGAGTFAFMDGHAELHAWVGSARNHPVRRMQVLPQAIPADPDLAWIRQRSPSRD